jgi:hypothetical protein
MPHHQNFGSVSVNRWFFNSIIPKNLYVSVVYYLKFVNSFFVMVGVVVEELEHHIAMAKAQFKMANESLAIAKTKKDASIVAAQKVCNQMED